MAKIVRLYLAVMLFYITLMVPVHVSFGPIKWQYQNMIILTVFLPPKKKYMGKTLL